MRATISSRLRRLTVMLVVVTLAILGMTIRANMPAARADSTVPSVSIVGDALNPGDDLTVHVTITNPNDSPIINPFLRVSLGETLFNTQSAYLNWTKLAATANAYTYLGPTAYNAPTDELPAGKTVTRTIKIKNRYLQLAGVTTQHGILSLGVKLSFGRTFVAAATSGVAWNMASATPSQISLLIPITAPTTAAAYYTEQQLDEMMQPGGTLARQLDAIGSSPVAVAADPKIVASVQKLGSNAPDHVTAWLARLQRLPSVTPLMWSDADPIAVAARTKVLSVTPALATSSNWQHTDWLVPASRRLKPSVLKYAAKAGYRTIVASDADFTGNLAMPVTGKLSIALAFSAPGKSLASYMASGSSDNLTSFLNLTTIAASHTTYRGTPIVLMPRNWSNNPERLKEVIAGMATSTWLQPQTSLSSPTGQTTKATLAEDGHSLLARGHVRALLDKFAAVKRFSTIAEHPATIADDSARHVASLLSAAWHGQDNAWVTARNDYITSSNQLLRSVKVVSESKLTLVARTSHVPVAVQNVGTEPVTVLVRIQPTNGRVVAHQVAKITVPAGNSVTAKVPVRALANGHVDLRIQLLTPDNKPIGAKITRHMLVRAQWETLTFVLLGSAVLALFIVGLIRGIRRNRRNRIATAAESGHTVGDGGVGDDGVGDGGVEDGGVKNDADHDSADHDSADHDSADHDSADHDSADHDSADHDSAENSLNMLGLASHEPPNGDDEQHNGADT